MRATGNNGRPDTGRVLMISYAFPPAGGSGVQRSAKFAKFLPEFGWRPTVWSGDCPRGLPRDDTLRADLPADLDHHVHTVLDTSGWASRAANAVGGLVQQSSSRVSPTNWLSWRTERAVRAALGILLIPDPQLLWALSSLSALRGLIGRSAIDVIYSTHSSPSNHLLAWLLSRATHRPWIADYRDLWTDDPRYPFADGPAWRRAADCFLEQRFLRDANIVAAATEEQTRVFADHVPQQREKFVTITNGVDLEDFASVRELCSGASKSACDRRGRMVLAYVGRFTSECITPGLIQGLSRFAEWLDDRKHQFELRIVGQLSEPLRQALSLTPLCWTARGYVPHREAIAETVAADVLLLGLSTKPRFETILTGKIFEYFASARPILMVGPTESASGRLVRKCHAGVTIEPDASVVCEALKKLWRQWSAGELPDGCSPDRLAPFTRRHLAGQLAEVLAAARDGRTPARGKGRESAPCGPGESSDSMASTIQPPPMTVSPA